LPRERHEEPVEPFPVDVLPEPLARMVEEVSKALPCPPDFAAVPMLAVCGAAIGNSRVIRLKQNYAEPASIYAAVVAHPGDIKSPAVGMAVEPLNEADRLAQEEWKRRMVEYNQKEEQWKNEKALAKKNNTLPPVPPVRPVLRCHVCSDTTVEALACTLSDNYRGILLHRDELTALVNSLDMYKPGGKGNDKEFFLSSWSATRHKVNRKGTHEQGPIVVERPFLCITGCLTPDMLGLLNDEKGREDGFIHRILPAFPATDGSCELTDDFVSDEAKAAWSAVVFRLLSLESRRSGDRLSPQVCDLTPGAKHLFTLWCKSHSDDKNSPGMPRVLQSWWSKLKGYCARLALVIHLARWASGEEVGQEVDEKSVLRAAKLVSYFKSHAEKVHRHVAGFLGGMSDDAQAVVKWAQNRWEKGILENATFKTSSLKSDMRNRFKDNSHMARVLDELCARKLIRPASPADNGKAKTGRTPSPSFKVHTGLLKGWPQQHEEYDKHAADQPAA
jgi:hypothetical protein